jgi:hypothetical protein
VVMGQVFEVLSGLSTLTLTRLASALELGCVLPN